MTVLEALVWLAAASLAVRLVPFHRVAPLLGPVDAAPRDDAAPPQPCERRCAAAWRIGRAVERAARLLPWPALCLPQAMAAKGMLACRGTRSQLHLGVRRKEQSGLAAHAWLTLGQLTVVGGGRAAFVEVAQFG